MKYYKITNKKEIHKGMKYKTGLNVDIIPFNPNGDCEDGGIYFSREDILAFINMGTWIREVKIPKGEEVYENPWTPKKWKAHRVILGKRRKITAEVVKELIKHGANVHASEEYALRWASANGHIDVVRLLLEHGANVHANEEYALRSASANGHIDVVRLLLEHGLDVHVRDNDPLRLALYNRHTEIANLLKKYMEKS